MTENARSLTARATSRASNGSAGPGWTSPAVQVRPFVEALDRLGYDVNSLLEVVGLRRADLDDPDEMISCTVFPRVISAAIAERRLTNLGARVGATIPIGAFPLLDYLIVTTDSVSDALKQLVRYFHVVDSPVRLSLVEEGSSIRLMADPGTDRFQAEFHASIAVHHFRTETVGRVGVSSIHLMHEPEDRRDFERIVGCPVQAPSTWNGVEFTRESLSVALKRRDPVLRRVLEAHAAEVGSPVAGKERSTTAKIRAVVGSRLAHGVPDVRLIARQLAMSVRTLQRQLAAEGFSYQQLVDDVRRDAAERLLADRSLAIAEVAYVLGFSEPSAFHRAFKRWHHVTPREYRRSHGTRASISDTDSFARESRGVRGAGGAVTSSRRR